MSAFAKFYNSFVGADYTEIFEFIDSKIQRYKSDSSLVCDLGCGTGAITSLAAKCGYDMIGIDYDDQMLMLAKQRFEDEKLDGILLLNQDISEFELYGTVDVIYSTLDTLNYLMSKREFERVFKLVRNYLNYDGLFIFDVNTEFKFRQVLGDNTFVFDEDGTFCSWQSCYDAKSGKCFHELTYFEQMSDGRYVRFDDSQQQRYYSSEYIKSIARKYNFQILEIDNGYSESKQGMRAQRTVFVLKINK